MPRCYKILLFTISVSLIAGLIFTPVVGFIVMFIIMYRTEAW